MKPYHLTLLLALMTILPLKAFDYQTVFFNRIAYYSDENNLIVPVRIDSVSFLVDDSMFYPMHQILRSENGCFNPYSPSSLGAKIIVTPDYNYFFNVNGDTIKIKISASLNETWQVYKSSLVTVTATIDSVDTMNIMGITDSVKFCKLHAYDVTMSPLPNYLEGKNLILSKHYGFVQMYNFLMIPYLGISKYQITNDQFNLVGMTNPKLGVQNLTWKAVFDFQPGDEIHSIDSLTNLVDIYNGYTTSKYEILKYMFRNEIGDSIIYQIDRTIQNTKYKYKYPERTLISYSYVHDTVTSIITSNPVFDHLPNEPIIDSYGIYSFSQSNGLNPSKYMPSDDEIPYRTENDSCWRLPTSDGCFPIRFYVKGLGGPYEFCPFNWGIDIQDKIVYYKKGNEIWGTPLVITDVFQPKIEDRISVYPNPVKDILHFKMTGMTGSAKVMINDLQGKILMTKILNSDEKSISLSELDKGIYLYTVVSQDGLIYKGKFVKN